MKVLKPWKTCTTEERWDRIKKARAWIQLESASRRTAAQSFDVPLTTLSRAISQNWTNMPQHGADSVLSAQEEAGLVEVVVWRSKRGMCITPDELRFLARQVALLNGVAVSESFPTRGWLEGFMARHKTQVSMRRAQILSIARFHASDEGFIRIYHANLKEAIDNDSVDSSRVWNCDETGFSAHGRTGPRVICSKGMRANVIGSNDKENVSTMVCVSASGDWIPFMFIFAGVLRHLGWLDGAMDGAVCAMSESSYINGSIFLEWLKFFNAQLDLKQTRRPVLLILDGHFSHISTYVLNYARSKQIGIFTLPSQTSHFTQPNDDCVFQTLKAGYAAEVSKFPLHNYGRRPVRDDMAGLISRAFASRVRPHIIVKAFENTGIWPLSLAVMLARCIGEKPSCPTTPHINALLPKTQPPVQLTERQTRTIVRQGLDPAVANVALLGLQLVTSLSPPTAKESGSRKRPFIKGGVLMTAPDMAKAVEDAQREKDEKANDQHQKKKQRVAAKQDRLAQKEAAAARKKSLLEEKMIRGHEQSCMKTEDRLSAEVRRQERIASKQCPRRRERRTKSIHHRPETGAQSPLDVVSKSIVVEEAVV